MVENPAARRQLAAVDLFDLAAVLEGDPATGQGGYLDLATGLTWPAEVLEDDETFDSDDPRWYFCPCQGSSGAWQDMSDFVDERVTDPALAARLREDLTGKGAFRRFTRTLRRHEELMYEWLRMKDDRAAARAREWLAQEGLLADPAIPPTAPPRVG